MVVPAQLSRLLDVDGCREPNWSKSSTLKSRSRLGGRDCDRYKSGWLESLQHEGRWFPKSESENALLEHGNGRDGLEVSAVLATRVFKSV